MKKIFEAPELKITEFLKENVVTSSYLSGNNIGSDAQGYSTDEMEFSLFNETVNLVL